MTIKRGDRGEHVLQLQQRLIALGYPLPRFGADGSAGGETMAAVAALLSEHVDRVGPSSQITQLGVADVALINDLYQHLVVAPPTPPVPTFTDLTSQASRRWVYGKRTWSSVKGITLHQTACHMGERPERYLGIGAHLVVTRGGRVLLIHPFNELVVHGNGFNTQCIGIEMDGLYAGIGGDARTVWDDPTTPQRELAMAPTPALIASAKATVRWCCAVVAAHGGHVRSLVAHRQASSDRRNDPGSELWQSVGLSMQEELGLSDGGIGFRTGDGMAIPEAWDPRAKGIAY